MHPPTRIFLHFFDVHFLHEKVGANVTKPVAAEARLAARLAILWADEIVVPAASFFESDLCRAIIEEHRELVEFGYVILAGNAASLVEFIEKKLSSYPARTSQSKSYRRARTQIGEIPFVTRKSSASLDIRSDWLSILRADKLALELDGTGVRVTPELEKNWEELPHKLGTKAFVPSYARELLEFGEGNRIFAHKVTNLINCSYFSSFTKDWTAGVVNDLNYLGAGYTVASYGDDVPYRALIRILRERGILEKVVNASPTDLLTIKRSPDWAAAKLSAKHASHQRLGIRQPVSEEKLKVFIVHGRDHGLLYELKDFLQNTLHFEEPVVLMQQPNVGRTIVEKFEDYAERVDAAVVLLTPDDFGGLDGEDARNRARQNVVFELGYFVGKFGRKPGRTILMQKGSLELPSDLQGVLYIDVSNGVASAGELLRREFSAIPVISH